MTIHSSEAIQQTSELRPGDTVTFIVQIRGANGFEADFNTSAEITQYIPIDSISAIGTEEQDGITNGIGIVIGERL